MQLESEDEKASKDDEASDDKKKTETKTLKLPEESGEELIQKQVVIPSPSWEPFIKKNT